MRSRTSAEARYGKSSARYARQEICFRAKNVNENVNDQNDPNVSNDLRWRPWTTTSACELITREWD